MKGNVDWNCHLLPAMRERITDLTETVEAMKILSERFSLKRFCMMPDYDSQKETISMFLLRRFRSQEMLEPFIPKDFKIRYAGRALLNPELYKTEGLEKLCVFKEKYLPLLLPVGEYADWIDLELNRLLYKSRFKLFLTSCELYPIFYPDNVLERLFRMENTIYQFNYKSLSEPSLCCLISSLIRKNKTVLLGTSLDFLPKTWQYDLNYYLSASEEHMYITTLDALLKNNLNFWSHG